jgi:predicted ATPase
MQREQIESYRRIMQEWATYVPGVEDLRFEYGAEDSLWFPSVKEAGTNERMPLADLSFGTLTILALLTIIHHPDRPELILFRNIEHAIHPRGIEPLIETMRRISAEHGVQFIFTSHHPYVLDCFRAKEHWADVVIVEKKDGVSRLANMDDRLKRLHYEKEMDKVRLSELWYSGLMGGVANPPPAWDKELWSPASQTGN